MGRFCSVSRAGRAAGFAVGTRLALAGSGLFLATPVYADYAQTWGISTQCLAAAGACVAWVNDSGSFYHNPAGAADMKSTTVGGNVFLLDVRDLESKDSLGTHNPSATSVDGAIAGVPSFSVYTPITPNAVIGVGVGVPFGVTSDWQDAGIFRYNALDQSIITVDVSPTLAWKPASNVKVGAAVNIGVARQLGYSVGFPNLFGGPGNATSPLIGKISLATDRDWTFDGLPPGSLDWGLNSVSLSAGFQYDVSNRLSIGVTGRTKESQNWTGNFELDLTPIGAGVQRTRFSVDIDTPAFVQAGFAYKLVPGLFDVAFDIQRTFWSDAHGWGKPLDINLASTVFLGPIPAAELKINYNARDQNTYRFGATWHAMPSLDVRFGYAFDEAVFPHNKGDQLTFDNDRHIFATGFTYDQRAAGATTGWVFDTAFQLTHYNTKTLAAGESSNLGGLGSPLAAAGAPVLGFTPNSEAASFGGNTYSLTLGAAYHY